MMMVTHIRVGQCKRCSGAAGINPVQLLNPPPTPLVIILITNVFIIVIIINTLGLLSIFKIKDDRFQEQFISSWQTAAAQSTE